MFQAALFQRKNSLNKKRHNSFFFTRMKYLFLLFAFGTLSCNNQSEAPLLTEDSAQPDGTQLNDTALLKPSAELTTKVLPKGFYRVLLPCKNCKEIEHTIYFGADQDYQIEERRDGKVKLSRGKWQKENDKIKIQKNDPIEAAYIQHGDTLYYIHNNGRHLPMQRLLSASHNEAWKNKGKEGLEFFGVGNEPFWNIKIDEQKSIAFHYADWSKALIFENVKRVASTDSIIYTAGTEAASLRVTIYPRFCSDGMSDFMYSHQVNIAYDGAVFRGCGIQY